MSVRPFRAEMPANRRGALCRRLTDRAHFSHRRACICNCYNRPRHHPMQDLTTGSISRHVLKTTSFMLVTMVFQTLYFLVDLYWIGRLGSQAVAAVSIAGNLTFIVLALSQMLGVGTTTLVSHAVGQKDKT